MNKLPIAVHPDLLDQIMEMLNLKYPIRGIKTDRIRKGIVWNGYCKKLKAKIELRVDCRNWEEADKYNFVMEKKGE